MLTTHRTHIYQYRCFPYMKCKPSSIDFTSEDIIIQFHFDRFTFIYVWYRIIIRSICSLLFFCVFILWKWFHFLLLECFIPFMVFFFLFRRLYGQIHFLVFGIRLICPLAPRFASQLYTPALFLDSFLNLILFYFRAFL